MSAMQLASGVSAGSARKSIIMLCAHGERRAMKCPIPGNANHQCYAESARRSVRTPEGFEGRIHRRE